MRYTLHIFVLLLVSSCSLFQGDDDILLARLGDSYLYKSEIESIVSADLSPADSMAIVNQFINDWAKKELLLQKAVLNIDESSLQIDKLVNDYRKSLLIHAYEQELIRQSIDTLLDDASILDYYDLHKEDYRLKENVGQFVYLRLSKMAPNIDELETWIFDADTVDVDLLEEYSHQYAKRFYYNPEEWLAVEDILSELPQENRLSSDKLLKENTIRISDSLDLYLLRIMDYRMQDDYAPLSYVKDEIKSILLNKKKLKTIERIQDKLLEDAVQSHQFEIY